MVRGCGDATVRRCVRWCGGAALLWAIGVVGSAQQPAVAGFTAVAELARAYDAVYDARFDEVPNLLRQTCPPAPLEACQLLEALNIWWQIQMDPLDTSRDAAFTKLIDAVIPAAGAWTKREPHRAEAWFYLGAAYGARVQWRSLRGQQLAAARDGARIKNALEQAIALDPQMQDAYVGIGLYHYYADVAPAAARILRWLLLLPGGDRQRGLDEIARARARGLLVRSEAEYQLHLIYLWYEKAPRRALDALAALQTRHPTNPHFLARTAEVHDVYLRDPAASLRGWQALLEAARARRVRAAPFAETMARLGASVQLDRLGRSDDAIEHLRAVIDAAPASPYGALAEAHVRLAGLLARAGRRDEATNEYRRALATVPERDPQRVRARANAGLRALR
jgi:tetratricopeptide (TPR) repeat protein